MLSMNKNWKIGLIALTAVLFVWTNVAVAEPKIGSTAPSFDIKSTEGNMVNSKDLKGKVVVMFFGTRKVSDYVNDLHMELEETFKGKDAQLDTAIDYLLEKIQDDPRPLPTPPPFPDKSFDYPEG